jgi:putative transport protein
METARLLLEQQPMVALFLVIALGYLAGQINLKGLSLGVGAVLFVALAVGWFGRNRCPPRRWGSWGSRSSSTRSASSTAASSSAGW